MVRVGIMPSFIGLNYDVTGTDEGPTSPKNSDRIKIEDLLVSNCSTQEQFSINSPVPLLCRPREKYNKYLELLLCCVNK